MSRNIRQKYPTTPVKVAKRRGSNNSSSSLDLSDDDEHGYSGVEAVSESEDDDEDVVTAAEEKHILNDTPSPRSLDLEDDDPDEEVDDDNNYEAEDDEVTGDNASWDGILSEPDSTATELSNTNVDRELMNGERRVRFTGVPDSDSDSTTSETSEDFNGFFPDIFIDQNALDPQFRREIENDHDDSSSTSSTHWVYQASHEILPASSDDDDVTPMATPGPSVAPTEVSTPTPTGEGLEAGYETDGDTTEEDDPEPPVNRRKQTRRFPASEPDSESDSEKPTPFRRGKPRVGRFNLDKSEKKPIAVLNPSTRRMMIFTPQRVNRLDLSPESFDVDYSQAAMPACLPILNPGFVMMGAMLSNNTFGDFINTQPFGPTEAFFPLTSDPGLEEYSDDSEFPTVGESEGESQLKIEDFITFHSTESDEEESGVEWNGDASSPTRPRTAASGASAATDASVLDVHPLLSHFDNNSDAVGAFRRNQINQQLIFSDKASQESLAFSSPYHHGTLRGIKPGSIETVTTPITPARRHKRSSTLSMQGFELQGSPQKRKAPSSFTDSLHKKQRSISDMDLLQI